jgi:hypothetical protein
MEAILAKAISKGTEKIAEALKLTPGKHEIDETITLHVAGIITKSPDEDYIPTIAIPHKTVLALFVEKMGAVSSNVQEMLRVAMTEALSLGEDAEEKVSEKIKNLDNAAAQVTALLGTLPKKTRSGKTVCKITVEEVVLQEA